MKRRVHRALLWESASSHTTLPHSPESTILSHMESRLSLRAVH
jgi:hypothetical protein